MYQATILDCLFFDPFSFCQDGMAKSKIELSRHYIFWIIMQKLINKML